MRHLKLLDNLELSPETPVGQHNATLVGVHSALLHEENSEAQRVVSVYEKILLTLNK